MNFKKYLVTVFTLIFFATFQFSYALNCDDFEDSMANGEPPRIDQIVCPLAAVFSAAAWIAGLVFVIMIVYGAIKAAMASGDPKQIKGATQTWLYAGIGLAIILVGFTIFRIVARLMGLEIPTIPGIFDNLQESIIEVNEFVDPGNTSPSP